MFARVALAVLLAFTFYPTVVFAETPQPAQRFATEEELSRYGYPAGYRVKSLAEQAAILERVFDITISYDAAREREPLPKGTEGYFLIPMWNMLATTYGEAVEMAFAALAKERNGKFQNWRKGKIDASHLRASARTTELWKKLSASQETYGTIVVPAQFGLLHRGQSVRRARETFESNEFGLGAFAVSVMLLTHSERFSSPHDLWIDASGDEYDFRVDGGFSGAPLFDFHNGMVRFSSYWFGDTDERYGSSSAFLPQ